MINYDTHIQGSSGEFEHSEFLNVYTHGVNKIHSSDKVIKEVFRSSSFRFMKERLLDIKNNCEDIEEIDVEEIRKQIRICIYCLTSSNKLPVMNKKVLESVVSNIINEDEDLMNLYVFVQM